MNITQDIEIKNVQVFPDHNSSKTTTLELSYFKNLVIATLDDKEVFRIRWNNPHKDFDDLRSLFKAALEMWPEPDKNLPND